MYCSSWKALASLRSVGCQSDNLSKREQTFLININGVYIAEIQTNIILKKVDKSPATVKIKKDFSCDSLEHIHKYCYAEDFIVWLHLKQKKIYLSQQVYHIQK